MSFHDDLKNMFGTGTYQIDFTHHGTLPMKSKALIQDANGKFDENTSDYAYLYYKNDQTGIYDLLSDPSEKSAVYSKYAVFH